MGLCAFFKLRPTDRPGPRRDATARHCLPGAQAACLKTLRSFVGFGGFEAQQVARLQAALLGIQTPNLVLWVAQNQLVKTDHAEVLRRLLPPVQVEFWAHCGHAPMVEMADRFNQAALKFWARVNANGR